MNILCINKIFFKIILLKWYLNMKSLIRKIDAAKTKDNAMIVNRIIFSSLWLSTVEPPQIRQAFAEETLQPGPSMFLKCVASGNPTPEITWELDGKRLSNTERLQVGQYVTVNGDVVSHLNISSIHTNDGGLYKCIAASKVILLIFFIKFFYIKICRLILFKFCLSIINK